MHEALLRTGREVVVKVRRPGVQVQVELDLQLLRSLTSFAERFVQDRVDGEKVTEAHGLDRERAQKLARELFRAYVQQITIHGVCASASWSRDWRTARSRSGSSRRGCTKSSTSPARSRTGSARR